MGLKLRQVDISLTLVHNQGSLVDYLLTINFENDTLTSEE